jgi:hypothetical protein
LVTPSPIILVPYLDIFPLISQSDIVSISELTDTENYQSVRWQTHHNITDNNTRILVLKVSTNNISNTAFTDNVRLNLQNWAISDNVCLNLQNCGYSIFIGKLDNFPLMCAADKIWITDLTLIHKNIRSVLPSHVQIYRSIWRHPNKHNNVSTEGLDRHQKYSIYTIHIPQWGS